MGKPLFNESEHSYIDFFSKTFISATTLIGKYKTKFDSKKEAEKYVEKWKDTYPMTVEQCLYAWDFLRDFACEAGTNFHAAKEKELLSADYHEVEGRIIPTGDRQAVAATEDYYNELPDGKYAELILWNDYYDVSGTSDIVVIETIDGVRYVDIEDFKTNKELRFRGFGWERGKPKMMLEPLDHLEECEWSSYQLQLSLYAYLLELMGFTVRNLRLLYNGTKDLNKDFEIFTCSYLKSDVEAMLQHFKIGKKEYNPLNIYYKL